MSDDTPSQAMRPHGIVGRLFAVLMEQMNEKTYRWSIDRLRANKPQSLYEIGFGTGRMLELAAERLGVRRLRGVDPSDLMVATAARRLRRWKRKADVDLRAGDDTASFWPDEIFDAIVALRSFQFWSDPDATFAVLRRQVSPEGRLVLVLRRHGRNPPTWLPDPISRSADEIGGTLTTLANAGFAVVHKKAIDKASYGIVAAPR